MYPLETGQFQGDSMHQKHLILPIIKNCWQSHILDIAQEQDTNKSSLNTSSHTKNVLMFCIVLLK